MAYIDIFLVSSLFSIGIYFIFAGIASLIMWYWYWLPYIKADIDKQYCAYMHAYWRGLVTTFYFLKQ